MASVMRPTHVRNEVAPIHPAELTPWFLTSRPIHRIGVLHFAHGADCLSLTHSRIVPVLLVVIRWSSSREEIERGAPVADALGNVDDRRCSLNGAIGPGRGLQHYQASCIYDPPDFTLRLAHKDVTLATELGRELRVPMRVAGLALEELTEALNRGW